MQSSNKSKVEQELNDAKSSLSTESITLAIADKIQRRARKGMDFNACVVGENELSAFLTELEKNKLALPEGIRFQFVYKMGDHCSFADVRKNHGNFEFFLFDAANALPEVLTTLSFIQAIHPQAVIHYSGGFIQTDYENCAIFALDIAYRAAKILDLHEVLNELKGETFELTRKSGDSERLVKKLKEFKIFSTLTDEEINEKIENIKKNIKYIGIQKLPAKFAPLFRNVQYEKLMKQFLQDDKFYLCKGSDKQTFADYLVKTIKLPEEEKSDIHDNITAKKANIKKKAAQFLKNLPDNQAYLKIQKAQKEFALLAQLKEKKPLTDEEKEKYFKNEEQFILSRWVNEFKKGSSINYNDRGAGYTSISLLNSNKTKTLVSINQDHASLTETWGNVFCFTELNIACLVPAKLNYFVLTTFMQAICQKALELKANSISAYAIHPSLENLLQQFFQENHNITLVVEKDDEGNFRFSVPCNQLRTEKLRLLS